ncbi:MAG: RND transporter, partial [Simkaniaceae bacterium]|nr:RND transporter [Simkaniaceae bacterium]
MKGFKTSIFILSFLFLGSCAVGPNYETPIVSLPDKFKDPEVQSSKEDLSSLKEWWTSFNDPLLDLLV